MDPTRIIHRVAVVESGGSYAAQNRNSDGAGLAFGLLQWTQRSGSLGALLRTMSKADPARFSQVFGADAGRLLTVTTASDEATRMSLSLWTPPWTARFAAAGAAPSLQRAQLRHAQTGVEWKATLEIMALFNLHTERAEAARPLGPLEQPERQARAVAVAILRGVAPARLDDGDAVDDPCGVHHVFSAKVPDGNSPVGSMGVPPTPARSRATPHPASPSPASAPPSTATSTHTSR